MIMCYPPPGYGLGLVTILHRVTFTRSILCMQCVCVCVYWLVNLPSMVYSQPHSVLCYKYTVCIVSISGDHPSTHN